MSQFYWVFHSKESQYYSIFHSQPSQNHLIFQWGNFIQHFNYNEAVSFSILFAYFFHSLIYNRANSFFYIACMWMIHEATLSRLHNFGECWPSMHHGSFLGTSLTCSSSRSTWGQIIFYSLFKFEAIFRYEWVTKS